MAEQESRESIIDETPIAPVRPASHVRQNSLEKHLQHRPDPKELKERHILLDTNAAPALQSAAYELERQRATDSLKKGLEKRPQKEDLIERMHFLPLLKIQFANFVPIGNILPHSTAAPAIQGHQRELEKSMRADSLNEKLGNRPKPEDLIREGVLKEDPTSPDETYEEKMEDEYAKREGGA